MVELIVESWSNQSCHKYIIYKLKIIRRIRIMYKYFFFKKSKFFPNQFLIIIKQS